MGEGATLNRKQTISKSLMRATRSEDKPDAGEGNAAPSLAQGKESLIQWPSEREIEAVSPCLARIVQVGICSEANGDYFKSGDLAYQIQEIIRTTAELLKKCQRG
jgi:hypothetical protein